VIKEAIQKLVEGANLTDLEARESMLEIMTGRATPAQISAFITALRMKGESVEEITEFARVMRDLCVSIKPRITGHLLDTCGTGGGKLKTFNVSTIAALVVAAAGVHVAKHGNRSVSSLCGSSDLLERLGVNINLGPDDAVRCLEKIGIVFLFAPTYHPAMKNAIGPRREIGITTVFNMLGPLTNPANPDRQVLGVYAKDLVMKLGEVVKNLRTQEAMVVHGLDGLDEISTIGETYVAWVRDGRLSTTSFTPEDFGLRRAKPEQIAGADPDRSAEIAFKVLNGDNGPRQDIVTANVAASLVVAGKVEKLRDGVELAKETLRSGAAYRKLRELVEETRGDPSRVEELERRFG